MTLIKYKPNNHVAKSGFNSLFDDFFGKSFFNDSYERDFIPSVDVLESEKNYEIKVSVPGLDKKDINVEIDDRVLTISGERKFSNEDEGTKYKTVETHYGSFKRSFRLPENVDESAVRAEYTNGILDVVIPKSEVVKNNRVIKIK